MYVASSETELTNAPRIGIGMYACPVFRKRAAAPQPQEGQGTASKETVEAPAQWPEPDAEVNEGKGIQLRNNEISE